MAETPCTHDYTGASCPEPEPPVLIPPASTVSVPADQGSAILAEAQVNLGAGRWFLFDANTGEFYADRGSRLGCERSVASALGVSRRSLTVEPLPDGTGGWMISAPVEDPILPAAFFALPADHPSIIVRTMLAAPTEK